MTARDAPTKARRVVKRAPFIRKEIHRISKAEEAATPGATAERERITASFARDLRTAENAIAEARAVAADFDRAHIILRTKAADLKPAGPVSRLAAVLVEMGESAPSTIELASTASARAESASEQAQTRLDDAEPELRSVALQCQLAAMLPGVKYNRDHPTIRAVKNAMHDASAIAAARRKGSAP
ncbi:hypothetical protein [Falsiphaeobacter marinintestinus]|uniref:hypothetical protein n=1 Tax=Falsiphaeobacter marinintestinus TaxID=1492905 RepID=UPI0011B84D40|nr:hypothetical protein [Phaeobacter marinintestinus]